jgi:hypothetical protein
VDNNSPDDRLLMINTAIEATFDTNSFTPIRDINQPATIQFEEMEVDMYCYFTNVNKTGDLETLLRKIAAKEAKHADCLDSWRKCLYSNGIEISNKDFDTLWMSNYIRFDTCSQKEKTHAEKKCSMRSFDYVMKNKKDIFNYSHEILNDLKKFLMLFKNDSY